MKRHPQKARLVRYSSRMDTYSTFGHTASAGQREAKEANSPSSPDRRLIQSYSSHDIPINNNQDGHASFESVRVCVGGYIDAVRVRVRDRE